MHGKTGVEIEEVRVILPSSQQINRPNISVEKVTDLCKEKYLKIL